MNKAELIAAIAEESKLTKKDSEAALKAFITAVSASLEKGEKVQLVGFGTFEVRERKARVGRNPRTKEEIKIPASKAPSFKAGKDLKTKVNVQPKKRGRKKAEK
ncbi:MULTISPECIES: HU family DNA-binding protein [Youngiibacter]|uniref:Transcriptional regulator n=2 Tax=Youngiibacter TaxID=1408818 RepID=V7I792_9CLOT|nr:HU family DNA-binding protein [Youngiibacter fragilis]ETA80892.1 transcriptional regulator [Youngiibacter fragilis 232.1]MBP1918685.1 DNA-binding protein HU-beta [Youngiibacter multivorans]MBW8382296.1 HU family DNA-binding protein [Youngiibacter sp.]